MMWKIVQYIDLERNSLHSNVFVKVKRNLRKDGIPPTASIHSSFISVTLSVLEIRSVMEACEEVTEKSFGDAEKSN